MGDLRNKKVLVFGLGLLGGGVATTNWLLRQGAHVTVSDTKTEKELASSVKKINPVKLRHGAGKFQGSILKFELGKQTKEQIDEHEIIVVNPAVPVSNLLIQYAFKKGKTVENEATLFFKYFGHPIVAVTGTRGKTTTTTWINHFLAGKFKSSVVGNSTENPFLKIVDRADKLDIAVAEMPSFHLELFRQHQVVPQIAVITNLFVDHVNWHGTFKNYARAKANIFFNQKPGQCLILNADNIGTKLFLKLKPQSHVWFFSKKPLAKNQNGVFYRHQSVYYQFEGRAHTVLKLGNFVSEMGEHNLENLLAASLSAFLASVPGKDIQKKIATLPNIPFRQEIVYEDKKLKIINDTTATSPEGGIAALKRFGGKNTILITGGTDPAPIFSADRQPPAGGKGWDWSGADAGLDFREWAKELPKHIKSGNVIFLAGSATDKMKKELTTYNLQLITFETLEECVKEALRKAGKYRKSVILFSPASKSFEKFKNEYDRGKKFDSLVRRLAPL